MVSENFGLTLSTVSHSELDSAVGKQVKRVIIPALALMREDWPIAGDVVFGRTYIGPGNQLATELPLISLDATDTFFDSLIYK